MDNQLPPLSPIPAIPQAYLGHYAGGSSETSPMEGQRPTHHHSSSESFLLEDQPCWLDELLHEPDELLPRGHRRSSSDSYVHLNAQAVKFRQNEHHRFQNTAPAPRGFKNYDHNQTFPQQNKESGGMKLSATNGVESKSRKDETSSETKIDPRRAKQQSAHRSRIRKLQYISELERYVEMLQAEGFQVSAELEFVEQQNLILGMENAALKQQLDNMTQEQHIKYMEKDLLERERARLQTLYHHQQQHQQQQQRQHYLAQEGVKSRAFNPQFTLSPTQHREPKTNGIQLIPQCVRNC